MNNNRRITPLTQLSDFNNDVEQLDDSEQLEKYKEVKLEDYKNSDKVLHSPVSEKISHIDKNITIHKTEYEFQKISEKIKNVYEIAAFLKQNDKDAYKTASNFFERDNTIFYIIIGTLVITCLLLLKKSINM